MLSAWCSGVGNTDVLGIPECLAGCIYAVMLMLLAGGYAFCGSMRKQMNIYMCLYAQSAGLMLSDLLCPAAPAFTCQLSVRCAFHF